MCKKSDKLGFQDRLSGVFRVSIRVTVSCQIPLDRQADSGR